MAIKIQLRRDTSLNWTRNNPVLALGEPGLETDTDYVKYGDGSTTWNNLNYATPFFGTITTANVSESSNLYFSNARVYSNVITFGAARTSDLTTANVSETTNLYFSNARVYSNVITFGAAKTSDLTTANVAEVNNLYYTNARVYANVEQIGYASNAFVVSQLNNKVNTSTYSFSTLNDAITAGLTIDNLIEPAMARLSVINNGSSAYTFPTHYGNNNNPNIYVISGTSIAFRFISTGHPFLLQEDSGSGFANVGSGLFHSTLTGTVTLNENAQGKDSGTLYWNVPFGTSNVYRYVCSVHGAMVGNIIVKNIATI